jgi:hypothetical protein
MGHVMKFERIVSDNQIVSYKTTNPIPFLFLSILLSVLFTITLYMDDSIVELDRNHYIFAFLIIFGIPLYLLNSITRSESLTILPHGLQQTRTSLLFLSSNTFIPFSMVRNVLINEFGIFIHLMRAVSMHSVYYVLIIIKCGSKERVIRPVFRDTRPSVDELEQVYHKVQSILFT